MTEVTWQRGGGAHFHQEAVFKMKGKKTLLSGLSALIKLILALCMVLYLFISPSFLLPKLKSPNKDPPTPPKKGRGRYFKCFAKVQPNIRGLTIKKEKKRYDYMFVFKSMYIYISIQIYSKYMNIEKKRQRNIVVFVQIENIYTRSQDNRFRGKNCKEYGT